MSNPDVHILVPAYNVANYVETALDSIKEQTYPSISVFVYDDGSKDETVSLVSAYAAANTNIHLINNAANNGIAYARKQLIDASNEKNPDACFLWLDADDYFTDTKFVANFVSQMEKTKADVCLFNFDIRYEHPDLLANAVGLLKDKANSEDILDYIHNSNDQVVSLESYPQVGTFTSLGWTKGYSGRVKTNWPNASTVGIFEDFVYMSALFNADRITGFHPDYKPLSYLRRANSLTGNRTPQTFIDITNRLQEFKNNVDLNNPSIANASSQFLTNKVNQYRLLLESIIQDKSNPTITQDVLTRYNLDTLSLF